MPKHRPDPAAVARLGAKRRATRRDLRRPPLRDRLQDARLSFGHSGQVAPLGNEPLSRGQAYARIYGGIGGIVHHMFELLHEILAIEITLNPLDRGTGELERKKDICLDALFFWHIDAFCFQPARGTNQQPVQLSWQFIGVYEHHSVAD